VCQSQSNINYGDAIVPSFMQQPYAYTQVSWTIGNSAVRLPAEAESHYCNFDGCKRSFKRKGDLTKHKKKHDPPEHHCPYDLCSRAFPKGFHLKDKLVDHLVAKHKRIKEEAKQLVKISVRPSYDSEADSVTTHSRQDWVAHIGTTQSCTPGMN
jgi:hypothetical protein